jgi:hypothetical protein
VKREAEAQLSIPSLEEAPIEIETVPAASGDRKLTGDKAAAAVSQAPPLNMVVESMAGDTGRGQRGYDSMGMEGVPGGPRPPVIDVGAVVAALGQLEKHTTYR